MKKLLSFLLAALMLAPLCAAVPAAAADEVNIAVDSVDPAVRGAEGAQLFVRVPASPRWGALEATVTFDPEALTFAGFTLNPALAEQIADGEPCIFGVNGENAAAGTVKFGYASASDAGGYEGYYPGEYDYFGVISFDIPSTAPLGFTAVTLTVTELTRSVGDLPVPVEFTVTSGGFNIVCGHDWQVTESVAATCEESGYASYECALCGATYYEQFDALGHAWSEWEEIKPADCTENGVEVRVCANNEEHVERRMTDPLGHVWSEWETVSAATCVAKEVQTRVCSRDASHTETREVGEPDLENGHAWGEWETVSPATCVSRAVQTRVCANDASHTETRVTGDFDLENGHDWGEWETVSAATCVSGEVQSRVCRSDASHTETREYGESDPEAHDWGEWEVTVSATCTGGATETRKCSRCDATETRDGEGPLGHDWGEWEVTTPATCTESATETRKCSRCDATETRDGEGPLGHDWGEWEVTTPATCTEGATETRVCSRDASHTETRVAGDPDPDAHDWGEWTVTRPATVFEDGEETRICKNDPSHTETRAIPKPEYIPGDVDFDGAFTVSDALRALRVAAGIDEVTELVRAAADADSDGSVTVTDALAILRKALGTDR